MVLFHYIVIAHNNVLVSRNHRLLFVLIHRLYPCKGYLLFSRVVDRASASQKTPDKIESEHLSPLIHHSGVLHAGNLGSTGALLEEGGRYNGDEVVEHVL